MTLAESARPDALLGTASLALLVYLLVEAPQLGWTSFPVLGLGAFFVVLTGLTILVEKRSANPLLPARLFRSTTVLGANLLTIVALVPGFGMSVVLSQYSLGVLGYTPIQFGLSQSAMPIASVVGAFAAQAGLARRGVRPVAVTALLLLGAGCALLVGISLDGAYFTTVFPGMVLFGLGLGAGLVALAPPRPTRASRPARARPRSRSAARSGSRWCRRSSPRARRRRPGRPGSTRAWWSARWSRPPVRCSRWSC
jgi:hypothetical protein